MAAPGFLLLILLVVHARPSLSDASFTVRARLVSSGKTASEVSCSSAENDRMEFSRVYDSGTGAALPAGARTYSRGKAAVLDLSGVQRKDKAGVYECGYSVDGKRTGVTFALRRYGYFVLPEMANLGDLAGLGGEYDDPPRRWLHDGKPVPAGDGQGTLTFVEVTKEDAGFYEMYDEEDRLATQRFYGLAVKACPENFFGEKCDQKCPTCYNGGVCHEELGSCVCPPGFQGEHCEVACGKNRVGPNCSESCEGGDCRGYVFCKPGSYGCSCATGYWGDFCYYSCFDGSFGADCKQSCHCNGSCDPYTGACSGGCTRGWTGESCQIPVES